MSRRLAELVAKNPSSLNGIDWRKVEEMMAEVFDGLGFSVVLTPPAKDGGKDLILACEVSRERATYVVEIKHWASGKRIGEAVVRELLEVVVRGSRSGGLILSTSGFTSTAFSALAEIEHRKVRGRSRDAVVTLCKLYSQNEGVVPAPQDVWTWLSDSFEDSELSLLAQNWPRKLGGRDFLSQKR